MIKMMKWTMTSEEDNLMIGSTVIARLRIVHLSPGGTFDLREGSDGRSWDYLLVACRDDARWRILSEKPFLVIGSPPCTAYCTFNVMLIFRKMDPQVVAARKAEAEGLFSFALEIFELQLQHGRYFLHEHPASASSCELPRMQDLRSRLGVGETVADLCQYGMGTRGPVGQTMQA